MQFSRITVEPDKMGGVPCIRGLRIPVTIEIMTEYPDIEKEDIYEALAYAK